MLTQTEKRGAYYHTVDHYFNDSETLMKHSFVQKDP